MHPTAHSSDYHGPGGLSLLALTAIWSALLLLTTSGVVVLPASAVALALAAVPLVSWGMFLVLEHPGASVRLAAAWTAILVAGLVAASAIVAQPLIALAAPAILISAALCARFPGTGIGGAFAISGAYGSVQAFTGLSGALVADLLLAGLWTGVILSHVLRGERRRLVIWPAIAAVGLFVGVSTAQILTADSITSGLLSYRLSIWYLLALILVAYAAWSLDTYRRVARAVVVVAGLVGAYAGLRWLVGPADAERELAVGSAGGYNFVEGELRVFGSFASGHQLGFWAGAIAPFCLAAAIGWRQRWRLSAGAAFLLVTFATIVSEVRGGLVGLAIGVLVVLVLFQLARSLPGIHLGRSATVIGLAVATVAAGLLLTAGSTGRLDRYANILTPNEDVAYIHRREKQSEALRDIAENPLGYGLGSASADRSIRSPYLSIATNNLDSSYLKVGYEQGIAVLVLFVGSLVLLLVRLAVTAVRTRAREAAAMGIGACGVLASTMVSFQTGMFIESLIALGPWIVIGTGAAFLIQRESAGNTSAGSSASRPGPSGSGLLRNGGDVGV